MSDMYKNWPNGSKGKTIYRYIVLLYWQEEIWNCIGKYYTLEKSKKEFLKIFLARHQQ